MAVGRRGFFPSFPYTRPAAKTDTAKDPTAAVTQAPKKYAATRRPHPAHRCESAVIHFRTGVKYYNVLGAFQDRWSDPLRHYSSAISKKDSEFSYAHK